MDYDYFNTIAGSITVSDLQGRVVYMNDKAKEVFGNKVGVSMMGCHNDNSKQIIERLIAEKQTHSYTIEKGDVKKIIYQTPWYKDGEIAGLIEFSFVIPHEMPHYIRASKVQ